MRLFEPDDYAEIKSWYQGHGLTPPSYSALPKTGFIMDGVAAGFLIETDTSVAIIDFFISSPESSKKRRQMALDKISEALLSHAKRRGFKGVKCDTTLSKIAERAVYFGFRETGTFRVFYKEI